LNCAARRPAAELFVIDVGVTQGFPAATDKSTTLIAPDPFYVL
jgi:hypothetical protein